MTVSSDFTYIHFRSVSFLYYFVFSHFNSSLQAYFIQSFVVVVVVLTGLIPEGNVILKLEELHVYQ